MGKGMRHANVFLIMIVITFFLVSDGFAKPSKSPVEPLFSEILRAHLQQQGLRSDWVASWRKRVRRAPWLPTLYVGYDLGLKRSQGYSVTDNISISGGVATVGPDDHNVDFDSNSGHTVRLRAVWKLDETVFNRNELLLSKEWREQLKQQDQIAEKLYKIFEQRLLMMMRYEQLRQSSKTKAQAFLIKYRALTEILDAKTGAIFHKRWRRYD